MSFYYPQAAIKLRILSEDFQLVSDASKETPHEIIVTSKNLTVNINDYKTASTFNCEIDYRNFPLDPRSCRYVGVVIYLADMQKLQNADGSRVALVPKESNAIFQGFVDEQTVTFDDMNQTVRFEGRDFTSLFIDQKYKETLPININQPLDVALGLFTSSFSATKQIKFVNRTGKFDSITGTWVNPPLPTLAQFYPDFGSPQTGVMNAGRKQSYWEIMQEMARRAGLMLYIHLDQLILTTPRNQYDKAHDLKMIYGRNVKKLEYKRKLGRFKGLNILVRSRYEKQVLEARIPLEATDAWCKSFGIPKAEQKVPVLKPDGSVDTTKDGQAAPYIAFPVPNIANKDQLIKIGQTVYEDYSRQQLEGSLETKEMLGHAGVKSGDRNWRVYDLTQLEIGQPIVIEIETDDLAQISRLASQQDRVNYLIRRNYDPQVASIFSSTMGQFSPRMFTKSYTLTLGMDEGFKLKINFLNIIELTNKVFHKDG